MLNKYRPSLQHSNLFVAESCKNIVALIKTLTKKFCGFTKVEILNQLF